MSILEKIGSPADVRALDETELSVLCEELRRFLIQSVSKTGGHLASNLGIVELTVAIHRVFDTSKDRLIFDVGHQCYVHKILTGRMERFDKLRQFGGLSGYPKPTESRHDAFIAGHASNSISVSLGIARARTLEHRDFNVVTILGDGALTGGLAYEALSDVGESGEPMIIILNDNGMSITESVGGVARYLSRQRLKPSYAKFKRRYRRLMEILPGGKHIYRFTHGIKSALKSAILQCSMFEDMGLQYAGPIDGHDLPRLEEALKWARELNEPVLIHVITRKGCGYQNSEINPEKYHSVPPFDPKSGLVGDGEKTFSSVFGDELTAIAQQDARVCAITAAMTRGTGLSSFEDRFPDRFFDVGIAEGHAASMAAGMACQGMVPVFAVYSSFLQRSYDMLLHDIAISGLHVVLAVDRAGLVGGDGETHQGIFDVGYLGTVPNMRVLCPSNFSELRDMLHLAVSDISGPVAIRYPRGGEGAYSKGGTENSKLIREGDDITIVTYGISVNTAVEAADMLSEHGISAEILKLGSISPIDYDAIKTSAAKTDRLLVLEECVEQGCIGQRIAAMLAMNGIALKSVILKNLGDRFIPQGNVEELREMCGIDAACVVQAIVEVVEK